MEWWERVIPDQNYREPLPQPGYEYDVQHLARDLFGAEQRAALMTTEERQSFRKSVESLRLRINKSRDQGGRAVDLPLLNP